MKIKPNNMLKNLSFLAFIAIVASCGEAPKTELGELKSELDSLRTVRSEIDEKIATVEKEIAKRDSTIENKLVTGHTVRKGVFKHYFEVYGNVGSDKSAVIYGENSGVVKSINVKEGQTVRKGQVLISQDVELINKNIAEIETQLDLATTLFQKQKRLWEQNIGSEVQYLEAKNRKESLENSLATAKEQKEKSTVIAPFEGVVDKIFPKIGELVGMASPMVRLVNVDELYINADVSERYLGALSEGDPVQVIINRKDTISSTVSRLGDFINPSNRSFELRVDLDKTVDVLRPNSLVVVRINDSTEEDALVIPSSIIMQDGEGKDYLFVMRADENGELIASKTLIETGMSYLGKTVVKKGISQGDILIDKGSRKVKDGDKVKKITA